jgi:prepilin-type processing-associated H-X9-DG protein
MEKPSTSYWIKNIAVYDWRSATPLTSEKLTGVRHTGAVNVLWADSHAGTLRVGDASNPYDTGMSSSSVKVSGYNYWDRFN